MLLQVAERERYCRTYLQLVIRTNHQSAFLFHAHCKVNDFRETLQIKDLKTIILQSLFPVPHEIGHFTAVFCCTNCKAEQKHLVAILPEPFKQLHRHFIIASIH